MPTLPPPLFPWFFRVLWAIQPLIAGPVIADAFADRSRLVQAVVAVLAWTGWGTVLAASLVPRTVTLTVLRLVVPASPALTVWSATQIDDLVPGVIAAVAAASTLIAVGLPAVVDAFVNGSSYGDEARVALRTPPVLLVVVVPLAWAFAAALLASGVLFLATEQWLVGAVTLVAGACATVVVTARIHQLSRRWIVFVPAGIVIHDPLTLAEPAMIPRHFVRRFGPAEVGTDAVDLTAGALGLVLELRPADPIDISRRSGRAGVENQMAPALLLAPMRPGTTLALAQSRRLPVA